MGCHQMQYVDWKPMALSTLEPSSTETPICGTHAPKPSTVRDSDSTEEAKRERERERERSYQSDASARSDTIV